MHTEILFKFYCKGATYHEHGHDWQEAQAKLIRQYPGSLRIRHVVECGTISIEENGTIAAPDQDQDKPVKIFIWKRAWEALKKAFHLKIKPA